MAKIQRALISVSDKTGLVEFGRALAGQGVEILSTGGTAKLLQDAGIAVVPVSDYTGFPEMLDGRVKTLHPKIHGGLLGLRDNQVHVKKMAEHGIGPIDLVVVNLYPFERTVARPDHTLSEAIENIDIGGPSMIRSAAKNHKFVTVVVDPADYPAVLKELEEAGGETSLQTRYYLASKAFALTARYDGAIANYLTSYDGEKEPAAFPGTLSLQFRKSRDLRYGENPHQKAAFYVEPSAAAADEPSLATATCHQGKELSFNNILDLDAALALVKEFDRPAAVVIKHTNPCGAALSNEGLLDAYRKAQETDPVSAFGGIVAFNREVDEALAAEMSKTFLECVIAPRYTEAARGLLAAKKGLRVLETPWPAAYERPGWEMRKVVGGLLVQDRNTLVLDEAKLKVVSDRKPTDEELRALFFAWTVCKHVKSNAIVYAREDQLVGVGAGQMSRVDSVRIARDKARLPTEGAAMASDAFFPFRDGVDEAAKAGIRAVIQPGGSVRDEETIQAANEAGMAMVLTGARHFRH
ncbi:MAG: bifunctional phosphoribosylaminoimidazolecarboxamide formyltransferase/IMP cyclohydrolase [Candidatus Methylomirabilis sp.]|nr:bifunctional phosphoribosylaminoimidazolecarboxamide formyltransferase/IMP cyclohydrolase [Deltaproteobacteria bacterium]